MNPFYVCGNFKSIYIVRRKYILRQPPDSCINPTKTVSRSREVHVLPSCIELPEPGSSNNWRKAVLPDRGSSYNWREVGIPDRGSSHYRRKAVLRDRGSSYNWREAGFPEPGSSYNRRVCLFAGTGKCVHGAGNRVAGTGKCIR